MSARVPGIAAAERLPCFIESVGLAFLRGDDEPALIEDVTSAMRDLVATDDWLLPEFSQAHPLHYQQYLLHLDPQHHFSVVSFVWGPGQQTPVHNHTVWGVIGVLRGAELSQAYRHTPTGLVAEGGPQRMGRGAVAAVSPRIGDIHRVSNAFADRVSISIHVYGTDIGRQTRHVFDLQTGDRKPFISGYAAAAKVVV